MKAEIAALLGKKEVSYATDPTPVEGTNAFLAHDIEITPLALAYQPRNNVLPYHANQGEILTAKWSQVNFAVELAGAGAAGTAPKWGPAQQACAMSETINGGVDVTYAFVSALESSCAYYWKLDGKQSKVLGWRGSWAIQCNRGAPPRINYRGLGLHVAETDVAVGAPVFTGWQTPVVFDKTNTSTLTLHGTTVACSALTIEAAVRAPYRNLPNSETVPVTGRRPVGSITFEDNLVATKDWQTIVKNMTTGALAVVHGPATNRIQIDAPAVQLTNPRHSNDEGVRMITFDLNFKPVSGNDELTIKVL